MAWVLEGAKRPRFDYTPRLPRGTGVSFRDGLFRVEVRSAFLSDWNFACMTRTYIVRITIRDVQRYSFNLARRDLFPPGFRCLHDSPSTCRMLARPLLHVGSDKQFSFDLSSSSSHHPAPKLRGAGGRLSFLRSFRRRSKRVRERVGGGVVHRQSLHASVQLPEGPDATAGGLALVHDDAALAGHVQGDGEAFACGRHAVSSPTHGQRQV